jgi:hypothetical protein
MKKIIIAILIGFVGAYAMAQENEKEEKQVNVPAAVKQNFTKDYPNVQVVTWKTEDNDFEAEFKLNDMDCSANYDKSGHRKEFEATIKNEQLPKAALDYIDKNYTDYKLVEAAKITNDKNEVTYEAEVGLNGKSMDLMFDANGKFLNKEEGD